jgi:hypothetical protein
MYLAALWLVRDRASRYGSMHSLLLVVAALVLASSILTMHALESIAILLVITVAVRRRRYPARGVTMTSASEKSGGSNDRMGENRWVISFTQ